MKIISKITAITLLATSIFCVSAEDKVIAIVNGKDKVMQSEIDELVKIASGFSNTEISLDSLPEQFKQKLIEKYVLDREIVKEAKANNVEKDPKFAQAKEKAAEEILKNLYLANKFRAQVTDKALNEKYAEFKKQFAGQKEAKLQQMLFTDEAEAKKAKAELKKSNNFVAVAKQFKKDENMDLGYVTKEQLTEEVAKDVFALKAGQTSEIIKSDFGLHIFKVEDIKDVVAPSLEEVKPRLESEIISELYKNYIETLRQQYKIEFLFDKSENSDKK